MSYLIDGMPDGAQRARMQSPQLYRTQAELCVRQAEHAKSLQHRVTLLDMAQTWLRMADEAEMMQKLSRAKALDMAS